MEYDNLEDKIKTFIYAVLNKFLDDELGPSTFGGKDRKRNPSSLFFKYSIDDEGNRVRTGRKTTNITYGKQTFTMFPETYLWVSNHCIKSIYRNPFKLFIKNTPILDFYLRVNESTLTINDNITTNNDDFVSEIEGNFNNNKHVIIGLSISAGNSSHQNVIVIEKTGREKNFYHFEPHGTKVSNEFVERYEDAFNNLIVQPFIRKGYTIIPENKTCKKGIQYLTDDPLGWCVLYSQLWLYLVMYIISKFNFNDNIHIHNWIEYVEKYLIKFTDNFNSDNTYALYILFFFRLDYKFRSLLVDKKGVKPIVQIDEIRKLQQVMVEKISYRMENIDIRKEPDLMTAYIEEKDEDSYNTLKRKIFNSSLQLSEPYDLIEHFNHLFFTIALEEKFLQKYVNETIVVGRGRTCDEEKYFCGKNLYCDYKENKCKKIKDNQPTEGNINCDNDEGCEYGICEQNTCRLSNRNERCRNSEDCVLGGRGKRKIYCIKDDEQGLEKEYGKCDFVKQ
jgi:hypothetical protein